MTIIFRGQEYELCPCSVGVCWIVFIAVGMAFVFFQETSKEPEKPTTTSGEAITKCTGLLPLGNQLEILQGNSNLVVPHSQEMAGLGPVDRILYCNPDPSLLHFSFICSDGNIWCFFLSMWDENMDNIWGF